MTFFDRTTKLRWRRRMKRSKQQVEDFGTQAEVNLEKQFFNRLSRLTRVRRFVAAWVLLFILLTGGVLYQTRILGRYYLKSVPTEGGIYSEGILGTFTNANPIYVANSVDNSIERLVFSGLLKYDQDDHLVGDLAEGWTVDGRGTTYTVKLKKNLVWHDGAPLNADDVVFTYKLIQTPDAKSPLFNSWNGITVAKVDARTVTFTLPGILSAFPHSLTNGLIPKHILEGIPTAQLRSLAFNTTKPIGSGPFKWEAVEVTGTNPEDRQQRIGLIPNEDYVSGKPAIDKLIISTFSDEDKLATAFKKREINAVAGLSTVPKDFSEDLSIREYNIPLSSEVMVFFKNSSLVFSDVKVRQAMSYATNPSEVISGINRPVLPATGPLLRGQIGFDATIKQNTSNPELANSLLEESGYKLDSKGHRYKGNTPLRFTLTTQSNSVYDNAAQTLKKQWQAVGAQVDIISLKDEELQAALTSQGHNYDVLLYGISLGADPDVFAFWHSSQIDGRSGSRLNFSEYRSTVADRGLEGGRTRPEEAVRSSKYKPFLTSWRDDAPAVALYQPRYLYLAREPLYGFSPTLMNSGADRFNNVVNWKIHQTQKPAE